MPANIQVEVWRSGTKVIGPVVNTSVEDLRKGDEVRLHCPDDNQTSYLWTLAYTPLGAHGNPDTDASAAVLDTPNAQSCKFTVDWDGPYIVRLVINLGDNQTEDTKFIRVRIGTKFGNVRMVGAGERRTPAPLIPDDATTFGWTNDVNTNLQKILAGVRRLSVSGRILHVDPNRPLGYKNDPVTNPSNDPTKTVKFPGTDTADTGTMAKTGVEFPTIGFGDFGTVQDAIDWAYGAGRSSPVKWARPTEETASALNPFWIIIQPGLYEENLTLREHIHLVSGEGKKDSSLLPLFSLFDNDLGNAALRVTSVIIRPKINGAHHGGHTFDAPRMPPFDPHDPVFPQPVLDFLENVPVVVVSGISLETLDHCLDPQLSVTGSGFVVFAGSVLLNSSPEGTQGPLIKFLNPVTGTATPPQEQMDLCGLVSERTSFVYAPPEIPVSGRCMILVDSRLAVTSKDDFCVGPETDPLFFLASGMYTETVADLGRKVNTSQLSAERFTFGGGFCASGLFSYMEFHDCDSGPPKNDVWFVIWDTSVSTVGHLNSEINFDGGAIRNGIRVNSDKVDSGDEITVRLRGSIGNKPIFRIDGSHRNRVQFGADEGFSDTIFYVPDNRRFEGGPSGAEVLPVTQRWPKPARNLDGIRVQDFLDTAVRLLTPEDPNSVPPIPGATAESASWTPTLNAVYSGVQGFNTNDEEAGLQPVMARGLGRKVYIVKTGGTTGTDLPVQILAHPDLTLGVGEVVKLLRFGDDETAPPTTPQGIDVGFRVNEEGHATLKVFGDIEADNVEEETAPIEYHSVFSFSNFGYVPDNTPGGAWWPWTSPFLGPFPSRTIILGVNPDNYTAVPQVMLPDASIYIPPSTWWPFDGQMIIVKDESGTAGTPGHEIVVIPNSQGGTATIDGGPSATINTNWGALTFYFRWDGTTPYWFNV